MRAQKITLALFTVLAGAMQAFGWGWAPHGGHATITRAAVLSLPETNRMAFGTEVEEFCVHYSNIPDWVYRKDGTEHVVWDYVGSANMASEKFYNFHLPSASSNDYHILLYLMTNAVNAAKAGRTHDFACYAGALAHMTADWSDPAHSTPNDTHMTTLTSFLPLPENFRDSRVHGALEQDLFDIDAYRVTPEILAATPEELAFRMLPRFREATLAARLQVIPLYQLMLAGQTDKMKPILEACGKQGAKLLADELYTLTAIASGVAKTPGTMNLADYSPLGCYYYNYRQPQYFGDPYWGHPTVNYCWSAEKRQPLKLIVDGKPTIVKGFFTGNGVVHDFFIPKGLFCRFTARAGVHADFGKDGGRIGAIVYVDGKQMCDTVIAAEEEAAQLDIPIPPQATKISLRVSGRGKSGKNYGIFANPELHLNSKK